jgi:asparagine synthase (glutamine-hydrolysing)
MNGEIYNYIELRKQLVAEGHVFKSRSDTEVVLHLYEELGPRCVSSLRGMFAVAIYDRGSGRLLLARDRAGEKPLYYTRTDSAFLFASELKSILASGFAPKRISKTALAQYLRLSYIPAPLAILEDVYKLQPGHYMLVGPDGRSEEVQYWDARVCSEDMIEDYDICKGMLRQTVFDAVESCLVADVPVGTFLSGGIDSTIVTGVARTVSNKPIDTFTIGFKDRRYDESDRAQAAAELHRTNHHVLFLDYADVLPDLGRLIENIDEPFADSSYIPTYMLSRFAKKHVKTVLTGDAGDELFGGYEKYLIGHYADMYRRFPRLLRFPFERLVLALPDAGSTARKVRKVMLSADQGVFEQRETMMCLGFKRGELEKLLSAPPGCDHLRFIEDRYRAFEGCCEEIDQALYTDFKVVLEGDMLHKVDSASMLASLETRVPLLDFDVVELAARIPAKFKIRGHEKKIILRDTFSDLIPRELLQAGKRGFGVPIAEWLRGPMKNDLQSTLDEDLVREQGLFNYDYVAELMREHFSFKRNRSSELWILYVFQKWYAQYFLS